jgi:hypothetical protein
MTKLKNRLPSTPEDALERGDLFTKDGCKRQDAEFVGVQAPDTDPDRRPGRSRRSRRDDDAPSD